jgi:hypothetical protein
MPPPNLGAGLPAESNIPWHMVISPKGAGKVKATLLADLFTGFWVHWEGRAMPCNEQHDCPRCQAGLGYRWQGYIAVFDRTNSKRAVLALSEGAARQLLFYQDKYGSLRGLLVESWRKFPTKQNSPQCIVQVGRVEPDEVMSEHDIMPSLRRMWGLNERFVARQNTPVRKALVAGEYLGAALEHDDTARRHVGELAKGYQLPE